MNNNNKKELCCNCFYDIEPDKIIYWELDNNISFCSDFCHISYCEEYGPFIEPDDI